MLAFHNKQDIYDVYIMRVKAHAKADEIIQGTYWEHGRGCAVGCTIHGSQHSRYEDELGIPRQLAYLQDRLFEGLPLAEAKAFPLAFLTAIPVGADLSLILPRFLVWLLSDPEYGTMRLCSERGKEATATVVALYQRLIDGGTVFEQEWRSARHAAADAYAYAYADADAYAAVAYDAADAYAADAYDAADAYAYAYADDDAARQKHFGAMRDKLLTLLRAAPVVQKS